VVLYVPILTCCVLAADSTVLLASLALPAEYSVVYGAPATVWLSLNISSVDPVIYFTLMLYNKVRSRLVWE